MIVVIFTILVLFLVLWRNVKNSIAYPPWNNTMFMVGRLRECLTPEYVTSKIGPASPRDEVLMRTDWQFDDAMVQQIDMPRSIATPNKDGWGSLWYIALCDSTDYLQSSECDTSDLDEDLESWLQRLKANDGILHDHDRNITDVERVA